MRKVLREVLSAFRAVTAFSAAGAFCFAAAGSPANTTNSIASTVRAQPNFYSIALPHFEPALAIAPGRDEYLMVCLSCHSSRYVMMQPFFPQRQW